jgi:hypothetical protein
MKRTNPALWGAGLAGVAIGTVLVVVGVTGSGEVSGLASGYGTMTFGSALYLLAGLKLRDRLSRRAHTPMPTPMSGAGPISARF